MTITCQPMDAAEGLDLPAYSASNERQANAVMYGGGSGLALGARSGFRPGTGNVLTATSTTWTLQPCAIMITPKAATAQGSYRWASDQNIPGAITAANATYPRKDIVYIQVNDSSSGDGSGALTAPVQYLAGTPTADPQAPDLPPRSFLVGTITVPQVGGGSPTVVRNPAVFVSAGGIQPIADQAEQDALTPYTGMRIRRMDLGFDAVWNGTRWVGGTGTIAPSGKYSTFGSGYEAAKWFETSDGLVTLTAIFKHADASVTTVPLVKYPVGAVPPAIAPAGRIPAPVVVDAAHDAQPFGYVEPDGTIQYSVNSSGTSTGSTFFVAFNMSWRSKP